MKRIILCTLFITFLLNSALANALVIFDSGVSHPESAMENSFIKYGGYSDPYWKGPTGVYDTFKLDAYSTITGVHFLGTYFNAFEPVNNTFKFQFYNNTFVLFNQPVLDPFIDITLTNVTMAKTAMQTTIGNYDIYEYTAFFDAPVVIDNNQHWLEISNDLRNQFAGNLNTLADFSGRWGWAENIGGGQSVHDFHTHGEAVQDFNSFAFQLLTYDPVPIPEPETFVLFITGLSLMVALHRKSH